ncbi:unnamed protein product [Lactuca virosa]|uniref:Uncharacterized protein n=1 Tax=Lactuca virosa TaxID=75947 RepID=A0AAU9LXW2_9ASTR|nr:unnamed protein product [Lactuca virosa]
MAVIARFHILQQSSSVLKPTVISSKFPHQSSLPPFYCNPSFFRNNTHIRKLHLTPSLCANSSPTPENSSSSGPSSSIVGHLLEYLNESWTQFHATAEAKLQLVAFAGFHLNL